MTRSLFDGRRANEARRDLRHAVLRTPETGKDIDPNVGRRLRVGWHDALLVPFVTACAWAFMP